MHIASQATPRFDRLGPERPADLPNRADILPIARNMFAYAKRRASSGYQQSIIRRTIILSGLVLPGFAANFFVYFFTAALLAGRSIRIVLRRTHDRQCSLFRIKHPQRVLDPPSGACRGDDGPRRDRTDRAAIGTPYRAHWCDPEHGCCFFRFWSRRNRSACSRRHHPADRSRCLHRLRDRSRSRTVAESAQDGGAWVSIRPDGCFCASAYALQGSCCSTRCGVRSLGIVASAVVVFAVFHAWILRTTRGRSDPGPLALHLFTLLPAATGYGLMVLVSNLDVLVRIFCPRRNRSGDLFGFFGVSQGGAGRHHAVAANADTGHGRRRPVQAPIYCRRRKDRRRHSGDDRSLDRRWFGCFRTRSAAAASASNCACPRFLVSCWFRSCRWRCCALWSSSNLPADGSAFCCGSSSRRSRMACSFGALLLE